MADTEIDPKLFESLNKLHPTTDVQWFSGAEGQKPVKKQAALQPSPQQTPAEQVPTLVLTNASPLTRPRERRSSNRLFSHLLIVPTILTLALIVTTLLIRLTSIAWILTDGIEVALYTTLALLEIPCIIIYVLLYLDTFQRESTDIDPYMERANPWIPRMLILGPMFVMLAGLILLFFYSNHPSTPVTFTGISTLLIITGPLCIVSLIVIAAQNVLRKIHLPFELPQSFTAFVTHLRRIFQ